jgi:hypothetical protein
MVELDRIVGEREINVEEPETFPSFRVMKHKVVADGLASLLKIRRDIP